MAKSRDWMCFVNALDYMLKDNDYDELRTTYKPMKIWNTGLGYNYIEWQLEVGLNGRMHWQVYIQFPREITINRLIGAKSPLVSEYQSRKGSIGVLQSVKPDEAHAYCGKLGTREEGPFEWGTWEKGHQGDRGVVWDTIRQEVKTMDLLQIFEKSKYVETHARYRGFIGDIRAMIKPSSRDFKEVILVFGAPNLGKTKWAKGWMESLGYTPDDIFKPLSGKEWFDGYRNNKVVILDDYAGSITREHFLQLLDRNTEPVLAGVKGSTTWMNAERYIIISNTLPDDWYRYGNVEAIWTRITTFVHWTGRFDAVNPWHLCDRNRVRSELGNYRTSSLMHDNASNCDWM